MSSSLLKSSGVDFPLTYTYFSHAFSAFFYYKISVCDFFCIVVVLLVCAYIVISAPGGFRALQAGLHQPISRSSEEVGAESPNKESTAGLKSGPGARPKGRSRQANEELHHTGSTQR